nr:MAG TPA: hypothetical protein [Bacteriophage sp.]
MAKYSDAKGFINNLNLKYWTTSCGSNEWSRNGFFVEWKLNNNKTFDIYVGDGVSALDPSYWGYKFTVPAHTGHGRRTLRQLVDLVGSSPTELSYKLIRSIVDHLKTNATLVERCLPYEQ